MLRFRKINFHSLEGKRPLTRLHVSASRSLIGRNHIILVISLYGMGVKVKALGPLCGPRPCIWWPPSGYQCVLLMWPPSPHLVAPGGPGVFFWHNVVCITVLSTAIPHYVIIQQHFDSY